MVRILSFPVPIMCYRCGKAIDSDFEEDGYWVTNGQPICEDCLEADRDLMIRFIDGDRDVLHKVFGKRTTEAEGE